MNLGSQINSILEKKSSDSPTGIFSICSANHQVLETCIKEAQQAGNPILVETTCNQVNQFGGYTGMTPNIFFDYINNLAKKHDLPIEKLFLGGDHLGPSVWRGEPSKTALEKSITLIQDYVRAGFSKIHLDASMACADDPEPLPIDLVAEREAILCRAAIEACKSSGRDPKELRFVVGTEVPTPGGEAHEEGSIAVSSVEDTKENIAKTKQAFSIQGLGEAWDQVCAFVVQPGVEFSDKKIFKYEREKAKELSNLIEDYPNLIYEAHSTDYQKRKALRDMVVDHFAILKVGPAFTFAFREAVFSLEAIEKSILARNIDDLSNISTILDQEMLSFPKYWESHYSQDASKSAFQRKFSLLDRSRYYWSTSSVQNAYKHLIENLSGGSIPLKLIDQYLPNQYQKLRSGQINNSPMELISAKISDVLFDYEFACQMNTSRPL